ncbi:MAG: DUF3854 domain-containing protein [Cyanobacteriota bacterium]|nr:DUF3854 domain-containing protein [Cyanobacteriota bacterium]
MTLQKNFHSQAYSPADLAYQDCVVKSGIAPDIYPLNFDPASGNPAYDLLYRDTDPTTNSGISIEAARNLARCTGSAGYFLDNNFYLPSDLAGNTKAARHGIIKSKGIYRPEGPPAYGWICNNRFRQLGGAPIALDQNKSTGVWEPRRYHQPKGKPLEIFFARITVRVWKLVAEKAGLSMPEFPVIGVDGEAIGFWEWVKATACPIVITEGEKKACALISRGFAAICIPGITTGYRVTEKGDWVRKADGTEYQKAVAWELRSELQALDTAGREITIIFDFREGDYSESPEFKAATTTAKLFKSAIAKIAQLPGPDKGADDFVVAGGDIDAVISAASTIEEIQKQILKGFSKKNRQKAWALTYPTAWECNQRYLSIPYHSGLIGVKSPKGTGKTYDLIKLIAQTHAQGRKVLLLTHRIVLGRAICKAVGIPWIEEMNSDADRELEGKAMGFGLCVDSLHPLSQAAFDPLAWEGALVIVDEVEQVFWHALDASTCRENRQAILTTMRTLFKSVLSTGGTIRLQDADLSDYSIDFVREFAERTDIEPWIAVNHWQPSEPWQIKFYDTQYVKGGTKDDPSGLLKDSVARVTLGAKIWVSCDSQKAKSKFGSKNLEKFYRSRCPGKKILRIDAETVANSEHPAYQCAEKITELAALYDIVICSPSLATGVSVELRGHFNAVFGIFQGAISDNEVRQSLARVREPINRFVWCRQIAVGKIGNGEANYKEVAKSKEKDCRYNLQQLRDFDLDLDKAHNPTVLRFWAKYAARINSSIWDFRETVREELEAEGHIITDCGDDDRDTAGEINALRILNQVEEALAVAEAEDIDRKEFEELEQKRSKTDAERYKQEKFRLKEIYQVKEVTPTLRQLHQDRWHGKIQLEYLLTHNPDFILMRDRKNIDSQLKNGDGQLCLQDVRQSMCKVTVHKLLNTLQFCDPTKEWSNKSPEILEFAGKALKFAADIKTFTGIKVSPKKVAENPIGVVSSFLGQLGLKFAGSPQRRVGGERVRFYKFGGAASANIFDRAGNKVKEPEGLRAQIFEAWQKRDELALFEFQQQSIAAVEADVTVDLKPSVSKVRLKKDVYLESVTASPIDIENIPSVTTSSTAEPRTEPYPVSEKAWGWFQRKLGEWIKCRVLEFVEGRYLLEAKSMVDDGLILFRAYPGDLRWEAPIC